MDNCQDVITGGFAPTSETADVLSRALGSRTILSGSVSRGKNDPSQTLQMMERPLMTASELKSMPRGQFLVMKTGTNPMRTRLRLFLDWGITFEEPFEVQEQAARKVHYADKRELESAIMEDAVYPFDEDEDEGGGYGAEGGGMLHSPAQAPQERRRHGSGITMKKYP